jgi:hypothetical protein
MQFNDTVNDGNLSSGYLEDANIANLYRIVSWHIQKEQIAALERWLHTGTKDSGPSQYSNTNAGISPHLSTTTMGLSLLVTSANPFQIISAEDTIIMKLSN